MKTCYFDYPTRSVVDLVPLTIEGYDGLLITRINVPKAYRGQGIASRMLQNVLHDADKESITLYLEVNASDGLNRQDLIAWYERNGFKEIKKHFWKREPKRDINNQ